ncbi:FAD-dependent oxidoreductase [Novosphingobium sp. P6W]|uniref:FAD-dependent oxidoreductase n=1 Tax=Novosphingobium sp. P6W TaxID=1609758 RepID=UPI0005C2F906|nr:GMC family oxidoreductase [Novosphingobium sp. P6W]AXB78607.1 GMC family oxidoreductase [Novosphingobium sp. P6W]KIS29408.1 GMC family oxidoreductase [Novosphingobium sp. P6W]
MSGPFDVIVIGSGITGGWAAKELTERGLNVLMLERGRAIEHQAGYANEVTPPWELPFRGFGDPKLNAADYAVQSKGMGFTEWSRDHFVNDRLNPYQTTEKDPFQWRRAYQLGGRSLVWGRQCYRWGDLDWGANARDGHGTDWPIRYADMKAWYDHVEDFIGVSGSHEGLEQLPDGVFQPAMEMNVVEAALKAQIAKRWPDRRLIMGRSSNMTEPKGDRQRCQYRNICSRGCSYGSYFSTQSSTLPAARATGRLTLVTDAVVDSLEYDPVHKRISGVRVLDANTRQRTVYRSAMVFLCAGSVNSISVLLRSADAQNPGGLANSSGALGRYFMDHALAMSVVARIPGFEGHAYYGNRPVSVVIPRFVNLDGEDREMLRGYSYQGGATRRGWADGIGTPGVGAELKARTSSPGDWTMLLGAFAECLPMENNRVTIDPNKMDSLGMPQTRIEFAYGENERKLVAHALTEAKAMVGLMDAEIISESADVGSGGGAVHEMGGARMGHDPRTSVLNAHNQAHDIANLFVTDGSAMASSACQNPSLTYMALTARAAAYAAQALTNGALAVSA